MRRHAARTRDRARTCARVAARGCETDRKLVAAARTIVGCGAARVRIAGDRGRAVSPLAHVGSRGEPLPRREAVRELGALPERAADGPRRRAVVGARRPGPRGEADDGEWTETAR